MTPEQHERWKDFSLRMARTCYRTHRRPDANWIERAVVEFFTFLDDGEVPYLVDWDHSNPYPWCHRYGGASHFGNSPEAPCCAGDTLMDFLYGYAGPAPDCPACRIYEHPGECRCQEVQRAYNEQWQKQWGDPVNCCIRAGMDFASAPSAGVLGFTAGDVRRMYPEGVPDWVFSPDKRLLYWPGGGENGYFHELPDDAGVVL